MMSESTMRARVPTQPSYYSSVNSRNRGGAPSQAMYADHDDKKALPTKFAYNLRVWLLWLPTALVVASTSGRVTTLIAASGLMCSYIFDMIGDRKWTLLCFWSTLIAANVSILLSLVPVLLLSWWNIPMFTVLNAFLFVSGLWVSLQFQWIYKSNPRLARAMERMLVLGIPLVCCSILSWATFGIAEDATTASYMTVLIYAVGIFLFGTPLPSSFAVDTTIDQPFLDQVEGVPSLRKDRGGGPSLLTRTDTMMLLGVFCITPGTMYVALSWSQTWAFWSQLMHTCALYHLPLLFSSLLVHRRIHAAFGKLSATMRLLSILVGMYAGAVVIGIFEVRVLMNTLHPYLHLPSPWNGVLLTVAVYGCAGVGGMIFFSSSETPAPVRILAYAVSAFAGLALSLALGAFWIATIALTVGAVFFTSYLFEGRTSSYVFFLVSYSLASLWFLTTQFGFIDHEWRVPLVFSYTSVSMSDMVFLLWAFGVLTLAVPICPTPMITGVCTVSLSVILMVVEQAFVLQWVPEDASTVYHFVYGFVTSGVLAYLVLRCRRSKEIDLPLWAQWVTLSIAVGKIGGFVYAAMGALSTSLWAMAVLRVFFMREETAGGQCSPRDMLIHTVSTALASYYMRNRTPLRLFTVLLGRFPTTTSQFFLFLFMWGLGMLPLAWKFSSQNANIRKLTALLVIGSVTLLALRPEISIAGTAVVAQDLQYMSFWSTWGMAVAAVFTAVVVGGILPPPSNTIGAAVYAAIVGVPGTAYFVVHYLLPSNVEYYMSGSLFISLIYLGVIVTAIALLINAHYPCRTPAMVVALFGAWNCAYPIISAFLSTTKHGTVFEKNRFMRVTDLLWMTYAFANLAIALVIKFRLSALVRKNEKDSARDDLSTSISTPKGISQAERWYMERMPPVGNVAVLLAFFMLEWHMHSLLRVASLQYALFGLSTLLLLLNRDTIFFKDLNEDNMYFPVVMCIVIVCVWRVFAGAFLATMIGRYFPALYTNAVYGYVAGQSMFSWSVLGRVLTMLLTLPANSILLLFLKSGNSSYSKALVVLCGAMCAFVLVGLHSAPMINVLALTGVFGSIVVVSASAEHVRQSNAIL